MDEVEHYQREYEEVKLAGPVWGWLAVIGFSLGIVLWGVVAMLFVKDGPRQWDYGALPDTPGESVYSTLRPGRNLPDVPEGAPAEPPAPVQQLVPPPEMGVDEELRLERGYEQE